MGSDRHHLSRPRLIGYPRPMRRLALIPLLIATPAPARDALGVFGTWAAFRDSAIPRCYAIAMPLPGTTRRDTQPYAAIGTWPRRPVRAPPLRAQVHFHLSHRLAPASLITLSLAGQHHRLIGAGLDAWAPDPRMDAAITAAMRSAETMTLSARDTTGHPFTDTYPLPGAATAMDAAALACASKG